MRPAATIHRMQIHLFRSRAAVARRCPGEGGEASAQHCAGFTLLELIVAMAISTLLLTTGVPSFTTFLRNSEVRSTAESISTGLRVARSEATRLNKPVSFTLAGAGDPSWAINAFDLATSVLVQPPIQTYSRIETGKSSTALIAPANAIAVTFNGLGRVVSPSPIATPNLQQIDVASAVAGQARTLRIYVDDVHAIRICDPDPAIKALVPPDARAC
jgi:type IV fimbrial biogenesis protein FimT